MSVKIEVKRVTITRAEGLISECDRPETFLGRDAIYRASRRLGEWARNAPDGGGYDKCDFKIEWADGETYEGRADITREHWRCASYDLTTHVRDFLSFIGGLWAPERVEAHYNARRTGYQIPRAECLARYAQVVASHAKHGAKRDEIEKFLTTYSFADY